MPASVGRPRRHLSLIFIFSAIVCLIFFTSVARRASPLRSGVSRALQLSTAANGASGSQRDVGSLHGHAIASKLGNETAKAELGRATWKYFHTVMARFPDKPTQDESATLKSYVHLFQRLYPCGECARHFGQILEKFPPQVSSRSAAAGWACHVHNEVNKSLKKELFDCAKIGDFYDCGCADDEKGKGVDKP